MVGLKKLLFFLFATLIFFVPLILWPFTSEVFEFNKIILVYALSALITATWIAKSILTKQFIFRRTILDVPLLLFLGSQIISTFISIDPSTSFFGYYSRFNGGLLSTICYSLLYWAFVSNLDAKQTLNLIKVWLASAVLVSIYGVLEHFGIDKNVWVQDVQSRVFSTLGQPNWLAAFLVALMPLFWGKSKINYLLSALFFVVLLFTKSRSGLLGFAVADLIYWSFTLLKDGKKYLKEFFIYNLVFLISFLVIQTPFSPHHQPEVATNAPALEAGGTESGQIRKIVWKGALQVWLHYPIFGTGVETFAFSYPMFRPVEHNLVSEWDFIYNKAHNEYLNIAANTGTFGLVSYLVFIGFSILIFIRTKNYALLAGYTSLLVSNFFGFSVVPTQLQFFLFPALALILGTNEVGKIKGPKYQPVSIQKATILIVFLGSLYIIFLISQYWYADTLYTKGKAYNGVAKPQDAVGYLSTAIKNEPNQPIYHNEIAGSYANLAILANQEKNATETAKFTALAISESQNAVHLAPNNPNLKRSRFGVFIMLSGINSNYLGLARDTLIDAINYAPTDAKLYYNLGLAYARTGELGLSLQTLQKTIELKSNYKEARLAYAILLINNKQNKEAKEQLEYILTKIDPKDDLTRQTLESIK